MGMAKEEEEEWKIKGEEENSTQGLELSKKELHRRREEEGRWAAARAPIVEEGENALFCRDRKSVV